MTKVKRSAPCLDVEEPATPARRCYVSDRKKQRGRAGVEASAECGNGLQPLAEAFPAPVVTPAKTMPPSQHDGATAPIVANVRRTLFPASTSAAISGAAITPQKDDESKSVLAKRKLIFGRSVVEIDIKDSVRLVYTIVKKLTGSIGGNGSFGPIYGELTMGSMQKMINLMKLHSEFDSGSRFIDVGSGIGKPNLHVAQDPGVELSYGIEVEADRWLLGMNCLKGMLCAASTQPFDVANDEKILHRCIFAHGDITEAESFDPFSHVYMFSIGFPPALWCKLSDMWNRSSSPYIICFHGPRYIVGKYEFAAELVAQTPTSMHGSKEGHTGYIYKRTGSRPIASSGNAACDPYFHPSLKLVQSGLESLRQDVEAKVEENMQSGASTRSRRG